MRIKNTFLICGMTLAVGCGSNSPDLATYRVNAIKSALAAGDTASAFEQLHALRNSTMPIEKSYYSQTLSALAFWIKRNEAAVSKAVGNSMQEEADMRRMQEERAEQERTDMASALAKMTTPGCDNYDVVYFCRDFIRSKLKAPATAEFSSTDETEVKRNQIRIACTGHVDSQNGFGAMLRKRYTVTLTCIDGHLYVMDYAFVD